MEDTDLDYAGITPLMFQKLKEMTNDFSDENEIGSSNFATTYKGMKRDGEEIAVKLFHIMGIDDKAFLNEFETLMRLEHQNIVRLVAYCDEAERTFVEYDGKMVHAYNIHKALCFAYDHNLTLHGHLSGEHGGLDWPTRYRIIKGTCEGIKYLHHGLTPVRVVHRDIKPRSILLDKNMEPKLGSFELSMFLYDKDEDKICDITIGTGGYIPPEYINEGLVSIKSDIYSLGVVMLNIIAGPEGHFQSDKMPRQDFINLVHTNWRSRLRLMFMGSALDAYYEQVKRCTEIALDCVQDDRHNRPDTVDITLTLNETELTSTKSNMDAKLENVGIKALTIQQLQELTNNFSDKPIGRGSSGIVYKGEQKDGKPIAVKLFHTRGTGRTEFNERHSLMRLAHQNIVRLLGYCDDTEEIIMEHMGKKIKALEIRKALCFEYAQNGSLRRHLSDESHGLDWSTRYRIIKGTCEGLKYLHHGLPPVQTIHLDIKPDNILLYENMEPKLEGFAESRFFNDGEEDLIHERIGTRGYLPPEYIEERLVSKKFDIYSLGVVMLEIVAGHEGRVRSAKMPRQHFIDLVHENWRSRLRSIFRCSTLDAYCEQVKRCIEIALDCVETDRNKRPDTVDITLRLNKTETHKGFEGIQKWNMSFKELETFTDNFRTEIIGKGAFGEVYKGKHANGELVAVKRLKHHSEDQRKQIESEENLKNLEHENIVRLIGFCQETIRKPVPDPENPGKYTLMDVSENLICYEFLSNGSLQDKMWKDKSSSLGWPTRYSVIQGICKGLDYLHRGCPNAPIVHRDLKPGNVLLDDNMVPKLGDFGLSRIVHKTQAHITTAVGSSGYMAPETVYDNKSSKITPKSDIYSLGVLILEIVTGEKCPDYDHAGRHYIEKVRESRKQNSYVASRYPLLEDRFLQQVESWISIGLRCVEEHPDRRPTIEHIMHFLETEASVVDTRDGEVREMSFKELEDIMNEFSAQCVESIFGAVYTGTRVDGDGITMIKLKEQMGTGLSPAQFKREVNRMSFEHENILRIKGYGEEIYGGEVRLRLLCYEFFEKSLGGMIYGEESLTQQDWEARYEIIQGICHALKYLHDESKDGPHIHMAITPTNVWLDNEMVPKLGVCGLSRLFATDQSQIYNKEIVESRAYVAPEHVELNKISIKSDIYSLGVLIMEIVTGQKCPSSDCESASAIVANVHKTWMKDFQVESKYSRLDAGSLQQVKGCIKIGLRCTESSTDKRPTAGDIISMLEEERTSKPGFWNTLCSGICTKGQS